MSSEDTFLREVSHAINLKAENDVTHTNYYCKAEVSEKVNSKKSCRRNHRWRRRIKNIAGQAPKYNPRKLMGKIEVLYLTSRSIEQCQPKHKNYPKKIENQTIKLNKNILIAKTLEAFTPEAKFDLVKYTYFKYKFKRIFCL